jgi:uncharacterized protein YbjT (DUF2867 family)
MNTDTRRLIVVTGATGRQGGAVTRALLGTGWRVRALTRDPSSQKAQALSTLGAEMIQGNLDNQQSLQSAFQGAYGVYSVQNPQLSNLETEVRQGKLVADVAKEVNVQHFVYSSSAVENPTGVGLWDSKLQVEAHIKTLGIPLTILRPVAFMELMTDKGYYPPASTWHLMPKFMGEARPVGWIGVDDLGVIVAKIFAAPEQFIGKGIRLVSDVKSIAECRTIYQAVMGKNPPRFPMPVWLFKRFAGTDLITMWQWLGIEAIDFDTSPTRAIHPEALSVDAWLRKQKSSIS